MSESAGLADFRFVHSVRVRWSEVDPQQVVFNAHYLGLVDVAITAYWRALGLPYPDGVARHGGDLYMRHVEIDYAAPARFDERVDIALRCRRCGHSSLTFDGAMFVAGRALNRLKLVYVYVEAASRRACALPMPVRERLEAFERGEPMLQVHTTDWGRAGPLVRPLRRRVFIDEQGVPEAMEWDEWDSASVHAVARQRGGEIVGTARLLPAHEGVSRVGRMAVERAMRGAGVGAEMLRTLVAIARSRGDRRLELHAQCTALRFYERFGFVAQGEVFEEAGITHRVMTLELASTKPD